MSTPLPLAGIRIFDLTRILAGPTCTQLLGDLGADVIKVEPPGGDIGRWTGAFKTPGMSSAFLMKGRNKRSVVLDLKNSEAMEPLKRLVESADVFVHNIRPKAATRLGIDYESIGSDRHRRACRQTAPLRRIPSPPHRRYPA